ncbi:MAG: type 1 glutamine amidotransferase [Actinomycetota bacterium]|nr:type 1 glutamine amidotransferase [Actinomycetota bacterium]
MTDPDTAETLRVLVIQNAAASGPGRLVEWLTGAGIDVAVMGGEQLLDRQDTDADADDLLDGLAGLVLLGGNFMPDADERARWLPVERRLTEKAVALRVPVLGICLGGQLLALCAGGGVTADSGAMERGSCPVELLPAAVDDPLFGPLASQGTLRMIQNHRDSITVLPPAATLLATSAACTVQAFRVGECAWGLQFHPEADAARIARWNPESLTADGYHPAALIAAGQADAAVNEAQARTLISAFAAVVQDAAVQDAAVQDAAVQDAVVRGAGKVR